MEKTFAKLLVVGALAMAPALMIAQPNPGQNSGGGSVGGNPIGGGGAPIGSGIALMLAFGAGYGAKRIYDARKKAKK